MVTKNKRKKIFSTVPGTRRFALSSLLLCTLRCTLPLSSFDLSFHPRCTSVSFAPYHQAAACPHAGLIIVQVFFKERITRSMFTASLKLFIRPVPFSHLFPTISVSLWLSSFFHLSRSFVYLYRSPSRLFGIRWRNKNEVLPFLLCFEDFAPLRSSSIISHASSLSLSLDHQRSPITILLLLRFFLYTLRFLLFFFFLLRSLRISRRFGVVENTRAIREGMKTSFSRTSVEGGWNDRQVKKPAIPFHEISSPLVFLPLYRGNFLPRSRTALRYAISSARFPSRRRLTSRPLSRPSRPLFSWFSFTLFSSCLLLFSFTFWIWFLLGIPPLCSVPRKNAAKRG